MKGAKNKELEEAQALKNLTALPGVGAKIAKKIMEIIETGKLRKVDYQQADEKLLAMRLFSNVWGAGPAVCNKWIAHGFSSLAHLHENLHLLNSQQKIGLKYYYVCLLLLYLFAIKFNV